MVARSRVFAAVSSLFVALSLALSSSGIARAHEVGGSRFEAPIPLSLLFGGAAATVALTALFVGRSVGGSGADARSLAEVGPRAATVLRSLARGGFFVAFAAALWTGTTGTQDPDNLAVVFAWAVWLKGVGLLAVLAGSPWRVLSPWRTLVAGLRRLEGGDIAPFSYPDRLGSWPALVSFLAVVGVVENLTLVPQVPRLTAVVLAAYALAMVGGGVLFGPTWFRRADFFEVLYRLLGRVAPVQFVRTDEGGYAAVARSPWRACVRPVADVSLVAFVVAAVYTVSFDGFTSTPEFQTALFAARDLAGPGVSAVLYLLGFAGFLASFAAVAALTRRLAGDSSSALATALAFAPTVIPIAAAYEVAHNYPFVVRNAGALAAAGAGVVLPSSPTLSPLAWLSLPAFWGSQVVLVVAGHVLAVVAAHSVAADRYGSARVARRAHVPLTALMVGYTVLSLWIISRPVVTG